jgi:hypothetical protein
LQSFFDGFCRISCAGATFVLAACPKLAMMEQAHDENRASPKHAVTWIRTPHSFELDLETVKNVHADFN